MVAGCGQVERMPHQSGCREWLAGLEQEHRCSTNQGSKGATQESYFLQHFKAGVVEPFDWRGHSGAAADGWIDVMEENRRKKYIMRF